MPGTLDSRTEILHFIAEIKRILPVHLEIIDIAIAGVWRMFTTIYIYRVKRDRVDSFTEISEQISELYLANGALGDTTYQAENMNGNHGCAGMLDILDVDA